MVQDRWVRVTSDRCWFRVILAPDRFLFKGCMDDTVIIFFHIQVVLEMLLVVCQSSSPREVTMCFPLHQGMISTLMPGIHLWL